MGERQFKVDKQNWWQTPPTLKNRLKQKNQNMKTLTKLTLAVTMLLTSMTLCNAQVYYRGYQRQNGTYVQPHWQSSPDGIRSNNWNVYPNINPYTGRPGTIRTMPLMPNPFTGR